MIAALMLYSLAVTLLFGVAAAAAEQVLRLARRPARIVWVIALLAAVGFIAARFVSGFAPSDVDASASGTRRVSNGTVWQANPTTSSVPNSAVVEIGPTHSQTRNPATVVTRPTVTSVPIVNGSAVTRLDRPLTVAWITLSLIGLGVIVLSALRLSQPRRRWSTTVVDGVPVFVSHDLGPAVIGVLRYRIVVPAWVLELASRERDLILAHEREHATAGDPALLVLATVLLALMPWNVALWWMGRRLRFAIELDCDARVLHTCPDAIAYGSLLLDVSERTLGGAMPITALAEPVSLTERRIAAMTARLPRFAALRAAAAGAMSVALVVVACTTPYPASAPSPDTNRPAAARGDSSAATARTNAELARQIDSLRGVIASLSASRPSRVSAVDSATYVRLLERYDSAVVQGRSPPLGATPTPAQIRRVGAAGGQDSIADYYFEINRVKASALEGALLASPLDTLGPRVIIGGAATSATVMRNDANWAESRVKVASAGGPDWGNAVSPDDRPAAQARAPDFDLVKSELRGMAEGRRVGHARGVAAQYFPEAFEVHEGVHTLIVLVFDSTGTLIRMAAKGRGPLSPGERLLDRDVLKQVMPTVSIDSFFEWGMANVSTAQQSPRSGVTVLFAFTGRAPW